MSNRRQKGIKAKYAETRVFADLRLLNLDCKIFYKLTGPKYSLNKKNIFKKIKVRNARTQPSNCNG
jgi:hypothetical protein